MHRIFVILSLCILLTNPQSIGQVRPRTYTPVIVDSVKVYKNGVALDDIPYASYPTRLIKYMDEFTPQEKPFMTKYGSDPRRRYEATGFFRTQKIDGRWWIIDPDGYPQIVRYINGVRPGQSEKNITAFNQKYGNNNIWMAQVCDMFDDLGFNGFGAWSDQDLVFSNNSNTDYAMAATLDLDMITSFKDRINNVSPVFDPDFPAYCDQRAKELVSPYKNEKDFLGYFTDNELPFRKTNLDSYLEISDTEDPNRLAAEAWLAEKGKTKEQITDSDRLDFVGYVVSTYYSITTSAIRKYDPNHMILGSRIVTYSKFISSIIKAHNGYCDICSINDYESWENTDVQLKIWENSLNIPFMATEFYAKAEDSGLPNYDGGGNFVKTQTDRGYFYQTFCLKLLESKSCVGWNWFKYQDNDPDNPYASYFDQDANKGIVDNYYNLYEPLGEYMKELNRNVYRLIDYFDRTNDLSQHVSLEPVSDTFIAEIENDTIVNGNAKRILSSTSQDKNYQYRSLLKFNLSNYRSNISDYEKVILKIYGGKGVGKTIEIHGILSDSWDEISLNGKEYLADPILFGNNLIGTFNITSDTDRYYEIDVTSFVKANISNSTYNYLTFKICDKAEGNYSTVTEFNSKEADSNRPVLCMIASGIPDIGISLLKINDVSYNEFSNYKHDYDIKLPYTTSMLPVISAIPSIGSTIMSVKQAVSLTGTIDERTAVITLQDRSVNPQEIKKYAFTFAVLPKMDLFLLLGQSNMAGRGKLDNGYYFDSEENVFLLNDFNTFEKAGNPLNGYSNIRKNYTLQGLGPGYSFARKYIDYAGKETNIGLIVNAKGGSSISEWQKGNIAELYDKTMSRIREAQKWGEIKAILWHQGESDLSNTSYVPELTTLIDSLRIDLNSNTLFVAGEVAQWISNAADFNKNLPLMVSSIDNASYVSSVGLEPLIDISDPHFNATSQIILGERYAQKIYNTLHPNGNYEFTADYEFNGGDDVSYNPLGLNCTTFTATGVTKNTTFTYFSSKGWSTSLLNTTKYNSFSIEPQSGYEFSIEKLSFDTQDYSINGPANWAIRSSIDNYASDLSTGTITTTWTNNTIPLDDRFIHLKVPVSFRVYGYNAGNVNGSWYIDNIVIKGVSALSTETNLSNVEPEFFVNVYLSGHYLYISSNLSSYIVRIYDVYGNLIFKSDLIHVPEYQHLLNVVSGVYFISVQDGSKLTTKKLIVY